jgi:hypothetical protein
MARTHVIRDNDVLKAIVDQVGQHGRSRFLEETAREKLKRIELETAIRKGARHVEERGLPHWRDTVSVPERMWASGRRDSDR